MTLIQQLTDWLNELLTGRSPGEDDLAEDAFRFFLEGIDAAAEDEEKPKRLGIADAKAVVAEVINNIRKVYAARTPGAAVRGPDVAYNLISIWWDSDVAPILKELVLGSLLHGDFISSIEEPISPTELENIGDLPPDLVAIAKQIVRDHGNFLVAFPQHYSKTQRFQAVVDAEVAAGRLDRYDAAIIVEEDVEPGQQFTDDALRFIQNFDTNEVDIMNRAVSEHPKVIDRQPGTIYSLVDTLTVIAKSPEFYNAPLLPIWGGDPAASKRAATHDEFRESFANATGFAELAKVAANYLASREPSINIAELRKRKADGVASSQDLAILAAFDHDLVPALDKVRLEAKNRGLGSDATADAVMGAFDLQAAIGGDFDSAMQAQFETISGSKEATEQRLQTAQWEAEGGPIRDADIGPAQRAKLLALFKDFTPAQAQDYFNANLDEIKGSVQAEKQTAAQTTLSTKRDADSKAARTGSLDDSRKWVKSFLSGELRVSIGDLAESVITRAVSVFRNAGERGQQMLEALTDPHYTATGVGPDGLPTITALFNKAEHDKETSAELKNPEAWDPAIRRALNNAGILEGDVSTEQWGFLRMMAARVPQGKLNQYVKENERRIGDSKSVEAWLKNPTIAGAIARAGILATNIGPKERAKLTVIAYNLTETEFFKVLEENREWISGSAQREAAAAKTQAAKDAEDKIREDQKPSRDAALAYLYSKEEWWIPAEEVPDFIADALGEIYSRGGEPALDFATEGDAESLPQYTKQYIKQSFAKEEARKRTQELADPSDPAFLAALEPALIAAYKLDFGAEGFADRNVERYFKEVLLPNAAAGYANEIFKNPTRYSNQKAIISGFSAWADDHAEGNVVYTDPYGGIFANTDALKGITQAREATTVTKEESLLNTLRTQGIPIPETGDHELNWKFALGEIGPEALNRWVDQTPSQLAFQRQEQMGLSGFAQKPIQFPRTQVDPLTGETETFGYGDFPYSIPNRLEMQELLGGAATDDPAYLSFLIGSKDAPGPAFELYGRYPELARLSVERERAKLREEAIGMDIGRRGRGEGVTDEAWGKTVAEFRLGKNYAQEDYQSPSWEPYWEEADPDLADRPSIFPQRPPGFSMGPPGSGTEDPTYIDPIVGAFAQQSGDVKPLSFATMFAEHLPKFRSQFEATPQFQLQKELERTRKLQKPRTFVI